MPDRGFLRWVLIIAALLFALIWLMFATKVITGTVPAWMPPTAVMALAAAVAIP